jgi:hypothetical protein
MCSYLLWNGVDAEIMWIPSHVGLESNEFVDERASYVTLNGPVFVLLREWHEK